MAIQPLVGLKLADPTQTIVAVRTPKGIHEPDIW